MGITPRSCQGHIKVKSAKRGQNISFLLFFRMSMMVETHLGPNTEVHQTHLKEVIGVI